MRFIPSLTALVLILSNSCAAQTTGQRSGSAPAQSSAVCEPQAPEALVARPSDVTTKPIGHTAVATSLNLMEAKYVQGPCVGEIVHFNAGLARLASGHRFVIWDDARIQRYPPVHTNSQGAAVENADALPGYDLFRATKVTQWLSPRDGRETYLGVFKGKFDHVIARFQMLDGKPSDAEVLIRSRFPIASVAYLPAPDTLVGRIGFVQRAGPDEAWLYGYDWHHGRPPPLAF